MTGQSPGQNTERADVQVAAAIKLARRQRGPMRKFAEDLRRTMGWTSLSSAAVYAWESGGTRVPAVALIAAARLVSCTVDELLAAAAAGSQPPQVRLHSPPSEVLQGLEERVRRLEARLESGEDG